MWVEACAVSVCDVDVELRKVRKEEGLIKEGDDVGWGAHRVFSVVSQVIS